MIDMGKLQNWGGAAPRTSVQAYGGAIPGPVSGPPVNDWNWESQGSPAGGGQLPPAQENAGYGLTGSGFLFPEGWSQSASALGRLGREPIETPSAWTTGLDTLNPMAGTGMPTSSDAWWAATQGTTNRTIEDAIKNAAEQAGLGGMRWSTPLGYTAQDISGKYMGEAAQQWADREMAAQEAARQRQLEATGQLYQYGQGQYQIDKDEFARRRAGAAAAGNLADKQTNLALRVLPMMFGMGNTMQGQEQGSIDASYNNPYARMAQGYLAGQPSGQQQTYQPSFGANMMGALGAAAPFLGDIGDSFGGGIFGKNDYGGGGFWK